MHGNVCSCGCDTAPAYTTQCCLATHMCVSVRADWLAGVFRTVAQTHTHARTHTLIHAMPEHTYTFALTDVLRM